jgi:hypothetical protein
MSPSQMLSVLFQSGTGATAKIGINTTTPATALDVKSTGTIRGARREVATTGSRAAFLVKEPGQDE